MSKKKIPFGIISYCSFIFLFFNAVSSVRSVRNIRISQRMRVASVDHSVDSTRAVMLVLSLCSRNCIISSSAALLFERASSCGIVHGEIRHTMKGMKFVLLYFRSALSYRYQSTTIIHRSNMIMITFIESCV